MATNTYAENDANDAASLSRHFLGNESDDENDEFKKRLKEAIPDKSARAFCAQGRFVAIRRPSVSQWGKSSDPG